MGRSRVDRKGYTREQRLLKENQVLKRELAAIRKRLARIELQGRYENVKEAIEDHEKNSGLPTTQNLLESLKEEWKCRDCQEGYLEIFLYNKISDTWYYRKCNSCSNRTKSKKYSKDVKGIIKDSEKDKK
jgi:hypothetical protein